MSILIIVLLVLLVLYAIAALSPRLRYDADMTAVGLALVCATLLVVGGILA
jgi:hypothetical protein